MRSRAGYTRVVIACVAVVTAGFMFQHPQLTGHWKVNSEKSENLRQKLAEAMQPPGAPPSPELPPGAGSSGRGSRRSGGVQTPPDSPPTERRGSRGGALAAVAPVLRMGTTVTFGETDSTVSIQEGEQTVVLHPNGQKEQVERWGQQVTSKAEWKGKKLVIESEGEDKLRVKETYEPDPKHGELKAELEIRHPRLPRTFHLKRVLDPDTE